MPEQVLAKSQDINADKKSNACHANEVSVISTITHLRLALMLNYVCKTGPQNFDL